MLVSYIGRRALLGAALTLVAGAGSARAEPDLFIREYRVQPAVVQAGTPLTIAGDVYNADRSDTAPGTLTAGPNGFMVDVVLSTDEAVPIRFATYGGTFREDVMLRGGRFSRTSDVTFYEWYSFAYDGFVVPADTPPGDYFACAVVDPGRRIAESNEDNNTICAPVQVLAAAPVLPDFTGMVTRIRDECRDGRSLTLVNVSVTNVGEAAFVPDEAHPELLYRNYVKLNGEVLPTGSVRIQHEIRPGRSVNIGFVVHNIAYEKLYGHSVTMGVTVDPDNDLAESDEANNIGEQQYDLPPLDCG